MSEVDNVHVQTQAGGPEGQGETPGAKLPSLPVRALQVFIAPGRLFDALRERPRWIGAFLLVLALAILVAALIPADVFTAYVRHRMTVARPDAAAQDVERGMQVARITRYVGPVVGTAIGVFLISAVMFLIFELGMGGQAGFRPVLASTSHVLLIPALGNLVTLPIIISTGDLQASLSLDLLLPGLDHATYAFRFLHGISLFGLWAAVVLGVAMSRVYSRRSAGGAVAITAGAYVVFKALFALFRMGS